MNNQENTNLLNSSGRGCYRKISVEERARIIKLYIEGKSNTAIGELLSIKRQTIASIIASFNQDKGLVPRPRGGDKRSILSAEQKNTLVSWVDEKPTITLKALTEKVRINFNLHVDDNTVDRCLREFHYSLKHLEIVPEARNSLITIEKRREYGEFFTGILHSNPDRNILFLDEVGFCVSMRTKRGRSLIGRSASISTPSIRSRNISIIATMNKYGMVDYFVNNTPVNGGNFSEYLTRLTEKIRASGIINPILVFDNARVHKTRLVLDTLQGLPGVSCVYLPPYSPFLNPIENCFSKWKNYVGRASVRNEVDLLEEIERGFRQITSSDCDGYFRKMLRAVETVKRGLAYFE